MARGETRRGRQARSEFPEGASPTLLASNLMPPAPFNKLLRPVLVALVARFAVRYRKPYLQVVPDPGFRIRARVVRRHRRHWLQWRRPLNMELSPWSGGKVHRAHSSQSRV